MLPVSKKEPVPKKQPVPKYSPMRPHEQDWHQHLNVAGAGVHGYTDLPIGSINMHSDLEPILSLCFVYKLVTSLTKNIPRFQTYTS